MLPRPPWNGKLGAGTRTTKASKEENENEKVKKKRKQEKKRYGVGSFRSRLLTKSGEEAGIWQELAASTDSFAATGIIRLCHRPNFYPSFLPSFLRCLIYIHCHSKVSNFLKNFRKNKKLSNYQKAFSPSILVISRVDNYKREGLRRCGLTSFARFFSNWNSWRTRLQTAVT